ncbi:hypothetical protein [Mycobacterium dioxanotrophicus]|uniref:hypothetical protein n=1 Tax=Mycobacterium dioxanotrophicus TaxID=482462 RepID=UPI0012FB93F5|nr:hypothetical protein [Mycobacterium dioxanotrophicus]
MPLGGIPLVADGPRAAPRARLQGPQTTSTSRSLTGLPAALRAHASGLWSAVKSSVLPQSEQKGWSRLARLDSRVHAAS